MDPQGETPSRGTVNIYQIRASGANGGRFIINFDTIEKASTKINSKGCAVTSHQDYLGDIYIYNAQMIELD